MYNHLHPERKFSLYRTDGQHLYFKSAFTGLILYGFASILFFLFSLIFPNINSNINNCLFIGDLFFSNINQCTYSFIHQINALFSEENYVSNIIFITIITLFEILISIFWYHLLLYINSLSPSKKSFELVKLEKFPIEKLLYISSNDTNKDNKIVMITFSDKKVYIGTVHRNLNLLKNFSENHNIFKFIPFYSGYRNKDTLDVELTTNYIKGINNNENKNIPVLLDKSEIISIAPINHNQFLDFLVKKLNRMEIEILKSIEKKLTILLFLKNKKIFIGKFSTRNELDAISIRHQSTFIFQLMSLAKYDKDERKIELLDFKDEFHHNNENDLFFTVKKDDIENIALCDSSDNLSKIIEKIKDKKLL